MDKIIGNNELLELIKLLEDSPPFPHTLLTGPPGTGKTTIANYIAQKCNKGVFFNIFATNIDDYTLKYLITEQPKNDQEYNVILIDELHELPQKLMTVLYGPMENFQYDNKPVQPFTLIGATTELHRIPDALQRRFRIIKELSHYKRTQIAEIIKNQCKIEDDALELISNMCKGLPGIARNYIEIITKISKGKVTLEHIHLLQQLYEIDSIGLTRKDREYLLILSKYNILGLQTIASHIGEKKETVEGKIEPFLLRIGFIIKSTKGRVITPRGKAYIEGKPVL